MLCIVVAIAGVGYCGYSRQFLIGPSLFDYFMSQKDNNFVNSTRQATIQVSQVCTVNCTYFYFDQKLDDQIDPSWLEGLISPFSMANLEFLFELENILLSPSFKIF